MKKNIILVILLLVIDQIVKFVMLNTIGVSGESITIIQNMLSLTYVENIGAGFGIFSPRILLIGVDIVIIVAILKLIFNKKYELGQNAKLGLNIILAGGLGNLIDRIFRGYVIDYVDITEWLDYPVFNFADICIVIGVIVVFVVIIINTIKSQENMNEKISGK